MYTGIVEELGEVVALERLEGAARITVRGPLVTSDATSGDSLSINGVCLTVTAAQDGTFTADVMVETLSRSGLGDLRPGSPVNLERSVRPDGRLGGHLVQGHVDGTGTIISRSPAEHGAAEHGAPEHGAAEHGAPEHGAPEHGAAEHGAPEHGDVVRISLPESLARYVVEKGSVSVDGVSLTVTATSAAAGGPPWFEVSLIPETLRRTTLGRKEPGDTVNLEVDVIAKYVEKLLGGSVRS